VRPELRTHGLTLEKTTNISTDFLVLIGVAGIKLLIIEIYLWPLIIMASIGLILSITYFTQLGMKVFDKDSFSKAVFTWGWSVGGLVFGLALVKMIKKEENMEILEQFAFTYLMLAPIEIGLLLSMPYITTQGYGVYMAIPMIILALTLIKILHSKADKVLK
jgi:Na+/glutamate symporter